MISELRITDPDNTCIEWWPKVKWLEGRESIPFEPGLNILWGPNGSGKTTVMLAIARMLHAEQGGTSFVTNNSLREVFKFMSRGEGEGYKDGAVPIHDGEAIMHFDPMHAVGLAAGRAAFDWDFGMAGISNAIFKGSSGQTTLQRFNQVLEAVITRKWPEVQWHRQVSKPTTKRQPKDLWASRAWVVGETLKGTLPRGGPRTILLDEPDRSLDLPYQWGLWHRLAQEKGVQIIAASHSLVALGIPDAHYIEFGDGYLPKSERVLDLIVERWVMARDDLSKDTKAKILKTILERGGNRTTQRDPRVDPQMGDLVRVVRKGSHELRVVVERFTTTVSGRERVRWANEVTGYKNVMNLASWQKLCKDATVLRAGLPKGKP